MKLPRNLSGVRLTHVVGRLGYQVTLQTGSHLWLTTSKPSDHRITVPNHDSLRNKGGPRPCQNLGGGRLGFLSRVGRSHPPGPRG
jgi:predicted RNA binding protein YcfA (HicA-like mRNA interferase family)